MLYMAFTKRLHKHLRPHVCAIVEIKEQSLALHSLSDRLKGKANGELNR
jgi:hypothetical protein